MSTQRAVDVVGTRLEAGDKSGAAAELMAVSEIAGESGDVRRAALWQAGELYAETGQTGKALDVLALAVDGDIVGVVAHVVREGLVRVQGLVFLGIVADLDPCSQPYPPGLGLQLAHDDAGQGGLARTVGTYQGDPVPGAKG